MTRVIAIILLGLATPVYAQTLSPGTTLTPNINAIARFNGCSIATISTDDTSVTIDWPCVDRKAAEYDPNVRHLDTIAVFAVILKALRDGSAR